MPNLVANCCGLALLSLAFVAGACQSENMISAEPWNVHDDGTISARALDACGVDLAVWRPSGSETSTRATSTVDFEDCDASDDSVSVAALLREMVDLDHLSHRPAAAYTTKLQSSHNPRSDSATPGDADWHADQDFIELDESETRTLLDVNGPGALTRIWAASPSGILRVFVDGETRPVIEAEMASLLRGDVEPFRPPFAYVAAYGHNFYFPIPFAQRIRVTLTGSRDVVYYQISYRTYEPETRVRSFSTTEYRAASCECAYAADRLLAPEALVRRDSDSVHAFQIDSGRGARDSVELMAEEPGAVLRELRVVPEETSPDLLRATALVIEMDGETTVRAPLLDFFAMGAGAAVVRSLPVSADADGVLSSRWPMPFERTARIWLEDAGDGALKADVQVVTAPARFSDETYYFYARWRPPELRLSKPAHDFTFAEAFGEGYLVGTTLVIANPSAGWWGEGDERIYVDGEDFPSHFGTGTEDYFGYAWCSNQLFTMPYIGQTQSTTHESYGLASLYRFHVLDPISFSRSLRFDLEVRHWGMPVDVSYDGLTVWYARPGAQITGVVETGGEFRLPELEVPPPDVAAGPYRCGGEGITQVVERSAG